MITKDSVCFKCGAREGSLMQTKRGMNYIAKLLHHHVKYGEQEKIVLCCRSCHKQIHIRLRKEGKCKIPVKVLERMSTQSGKNFLKFIRSSETIENHISFVERLAETRCGNIEYISYFQLNNSNSKKNGGKIKYIDEVPKK